MKPEDVKLTEKAIERYDYIINPGQGKRIKVDWNSNPWNEWLLEQKKSNLERFIELMDNILENWTDYKVNVIFKSKVKKVNELIIDEFGMVGIFETDRKYDMGSYYYPIPNQNDSQKMLGIDMGYDTKTFLKYYPIKNKIFSLEDINFNYFNKNNILHNTTAIENYLIPLITLRPITDASNKKARELFGGLMD